MHSWELPKANGMYDKHSTIGDVISGINQTGTDNHPTTVAAIMKDFHTLANGDTSVQPVLWAALDPRNAYVPGVTLDSKLGDAAKLITPGTNLDDDIKNARNLPANRADITYGDLLRLITEKGVNEYDGLRNRAFDSADVVLGLLNPANGFGFSPGNDITTIEQNLSLATKLLDVTNPQSLLGRLSTEYGRLGTDIQALLDSGAPLPEADQIRLRERAEDIQKGSTALFNQIAGYMNMATDNLKAARDKAEKEKIASILEAVFSGLGMFGAVGLGISNGAAAFRQIGGPNGGFFGTPFRNTGNWPAVFGASTLFMNNAVNLSLAAVTLHHLESLDKVAPGIDAAAQALKGGNINWGSNSQDMQTALDNMIKSVLKADYYAFNTDRWKAYFKWVGNGHTQDSSLFNPNANDSLYTGTLPDVFWTPGQYAGKAGQLLHDLGYRWMRGGLNDEDIHLPTPSWWND